MKFRIRRWIAPFQAMPWGWGMAWYDHSRLAGACYPIPLNIVMRVGYIVWVWCLYPFRNQGTWLEKRIQQALRARTDNRATGLNEAYELGRRDQKRAMHDAIDSFKEQRA